MEPIIIARGLCVDGLGLISGIADRVLKAVWL